MEDLQRRGRETRFSGLLPAEPLQGPGTLPRLSLVARPCPLLRASRHPRRPPVHRGRAPLPAQPSGGTAFPATSRGPSRTKPPNSRTQSRLPSLPPRCLRCLLCVSWVTSPVMPALSLSPDQPRGAPSLERRRLGLGSRAATEDHRARKRRAGIAVSGRSIFPATMWKEGEPGAGRASGSEGTEEGTEKEQRGRRRPKAPPHLQEPVSSALGRGRGWSLSPWGGRWRGRGRGLVGGSWLPPRLAPSPVESGQLCGQRGAQRAAAWRQPAWQVAWKSFRSSEGFWRGTG